MGLCSPVCDPNPAARQATYLPKKLPYFLLALPCISDIPHVFSS